jgi:hypothetical protein
MEQQNYIINQPSPLNQNFRELKRVALEFIQAHSGYEWSNLNTSDPGVTILDQVCYALTELGYCNDFPINDILTGKNGKIETEDQFYFPEAILTTAPVSYDDYRKYVLDEINGIDNLIFLTGTSRHPDQSKFCTAWLMLSENKERTLRQQLENAGQIFLETFYHLNKSRNLGQLFQLPVLLSAKTAYLSGLITISSESNQSEIVSLIQTAIRNYIFPPVEPQGYTQLVANSVSTNDIFNGPHQKNGWIPTSSLGLKRDSVNVYDLFPVVQSVPGVVRASGLKFIYSNDASSQISSQANELIVIDIADSVSNSILTITPVQTNEETSTAIQQDELPAFEMANLFEAELNNEHTLLYSGSFRDINSYYSIQHTFPELFAVGNNAVTHNKTDYQIAQSRQLKGYLCLFDQVLANQFTQLANVPELFSFRNQMTADPSDTNRFYARKTSLEKKNLQYPAPYLKYAPTYFYQSLYDIPNIHPLLKGNESFDFATEPMNQKQLQHTSWESYQLDPYNSYIHGLMNIMETEKISLERRNAILNHLLARHGESPAQFNLLIKNSIYSGDSIKDQVIFKSLYIQNLGLLSYNRYKAYDYLSADRLGKKTKTYQQETGLEYWEEDDTIDSIINSKKINGLEKIRPRDCVNFSGFELKVSMLCGLRTMYEEFIGDIDYKKRKQSDKTVYQESGVEIKKKEQAFWFIQKRKGFILIENALLLHRLHFQVALIDLRTGINQYYLCNTPLDYSEMLFISKNLTSASLPDDVSVSSETISIQNTNYALTAQTGFTYNAKTCFPIAGTNLALTILNTDLTGSVWQVAVNLFMNDLTLLYPDFVPQLAATNFSDRLNMFIENDLPPNLISQILLVSTTDADKLIESFINWHDSIRFDSRIAEYAITYTCQLIQELNTISMNQ